MGVILITLASRAQAQMSPGPLAKPHAELDAPLKCFTCHGQGKGGSLRDRCLACHQEIAWSEEHKLGLHAREDKGECAGCHPDHAGRDFAMIRWDEGAPEKFEHARSGWALEGKHATLKCGDCHKPAFQVSGAAGLIRRKDRPASYLGLERNCIACHQTQDVHRGALGPDCFKCHGVRAWKPASLFNHDNTSYPLTGQHAQVPCEKCHLAPSLKPAVDKEGKPIPLYKPLPHAQCGSCHKDPHQGQLGTDCTRCHATDSWKSVDRKSFDHDRTRYPLRGRHVTVACARCHDPKTAWGKKPPFASCTSCHKDVHAGQATLDGKTVDCQACHRVEGFSPSTYTVLQHRSTRYPLEGAHARVKCQACHRKNPPGVPAEKLGRAGILMRMPSTRCRDCHQDAHGGQLARRADAGACESCHKVEGWKPTTYSLAAHAKLRLPLQGRHAKVECAACHGPRRKGLPALPGPEKLGSAGVALTGLDVSCTACHFDPHEGRFAARGARPKSGGCLACHGLASFRPSTVDVMKHQSFAYPLEGAHRATPCDACHKEDKYPPVKSSLILATAQGYRMPFTTPQGGRCEACHKNPHGNQFARRKDKGACQGCHDEDAFRPAARFDHKRDSAFSLDGAHGKVACASCHPSKDLGGGRVLVLYQPVPKDCKSCHGGRVPGRLSPIAPERSSTPSAGA